MNEKPCPLCHLSQVAVGVVEVLDRSNVCVWVQLEWELQARLVAKNTWWNSDVVGFVENLARVSKTRVSIVSADVAYDLARVSVPEFFTNATGRMAMRSHHQRTYISILE